MVKWLIVELQPLRHDFRWRMHRSAIRQWFGGRNQQWAIEAAITLVEKGFSNFEVFSYATDGNDGPTDSAGGWVCSN